jgi:methyl-accepting chemotaxis protein
MSMRIGKRSLAVVSPSDRSAGFSGRRPIGFQVFAAIAVVFAVLAAAVVAAVFSIFSLTRDQAELQERNVPYAVAISTAALNAKGMANDERGFLISGDPEFLEEIDQRLLDVRTAFSVATITADGEEELRSAHKAQAGFERWVRALEKEIATFQAGDRAAARRSALGPGRALRKQYEASLAEAQSVAKIAIEQRRNSLASSGWAIILLAFLLIAAALGAAVTFWLFRALDVAAEAEAPEQGTGSSPLLEKELGRTQGRNG